MTYKATVRYSFGVTSPVAVWGSSPTQHSPWPPHEPFKRDRDAGIWFNSSYTEPHHLLPALAFFVSTGWPVEALDDFLDAIVPEVGWEEEWVFVTKYRKDWKPEQWRRPTMHYGPAWGQLRNGYWEPKK